MVDPRDEPRAQLVFQHELMDNLDLFLEGHSAEMQDSKPFTVTVGNHSGF